MPVLAVENFDLARIPDPGDQATFHADAFYVWQHMASEIIPKFNANVDFVEAALGGDTGTILDSLGFIYGGQQTAGFFRHFTAGAALPASDIGPIWHADYASVMVWQDFDQNGAAFSGYASADVGRPVFDGQPSARPGHVRGNGAALSDASYAGLKGWAQHNGLMVPVADWSEGVYHFGDNGDGTFRLPDMRSEFWRGWDDGRGVDPARSFGSWQDHAANTYWRLWAYDFAWEGTQTRGNIAATTADLAVGRIGAGLSGLHTIQTTDASGATSAETRPSNIALSAQIKF